MKHKLLVAVDGIKSSFKIALYAAQACAGNETPGVRIVVFHVLPRLPPNVEGSKAAAADQRAEAFATKAWDKAEQTLAQLKEQIVRAGVPPKCVTTEIADEEGDVVPQIIDAASTHGCDTIVVGRHEESIFGRFLGGSVGEHLLRKAVGYAIWLIE
jgi:nucleotide-binding universal stress UspA family protein